MKTQEEIQQLAEQDFNDRQECGHYELADLKSRDYYYDGFTNAYNQCQEDMADKLKKFEKTIIDLHRKHGYFQGDNLKVLIREFESLNKQD